MVKVHRPRINRKTGLPTRNALLYRSKAKVKHQIGSAMIGEGKRTHAKNQLVVNVNKFTKPTLGLTSVLSKKSIKKGTSGLKLHATAGLRRKAHISLSFKMPSLSKMIARERRLELSRLRKIEKAKLSREERLRKSQLRQLKRHKLGTFEKKNEKGFPVKKVPVRSIGAFPSKTAIPHKDAEEREVRVKSSMVYGFAYNEELEILTVRWNTFGKMGFYEGVPTGIFKKLINGVSSGCKTSGSNKWGTWWITKNPSVGRSMWDHIFGKYTYVKIL